MTTPFYLLLFILPVILGAIFFVFVFRKHNSHNELYNEGLRNENDGLYNLALHNYEDALSEIRKLNMNNKFSIKIADRIKVLRTTIDYEKNFQTTRRA